MATVDEDSKAILEQVNELLVEGFPGKAGVLLGEFLDKVKVVPNEQVHTPARPQ